MWYMALVFVLIFMIFVLGYAVFKFLELNNLKQNVIDELRIENMDLRFQNDVLILENISLKRRVE